MINHISRQFRLEEDPTVLIRVVSNDHGTTVGWIDEVDGVFFVRKRTDVFNSIPFESLEAALKQFHKII